MVGAAVPEAAVDEDRDARTNEHDVRPDEAGFQGDRELNPEPITPAVEGGAQSKLRHGVPLPVSPHHRPDRR